MAPFAYRLWRLSFGGALETNLLQLDFACYNLVTFSGCVWIS
jgi:hypothetical protein